jgi:phospholipase/carboxylesterase
MQTENEPVTFEYKNRIVRYKKTPAGSTSSFLVLIHGLTGDENSMWVFASSLPDTTAILAPRAPLNAPTAGFSWVNTEQSKEKILLDLQQEASKFHDWLIQFLQANCLNDLPIHLAGFSQGASMVYLLMLLYPEKYHSAICMSGFLPTGTESWITPEKVSNARFFISHGNKDKVIPVSQARLVASLLEEAGAQVTYCEESTTHKMSPFCQKKLHTYLNSILV